MSQIPIVEAARMGDLKALTEILSSDPMLDSFMVSTALSEAAFNGRLELVRALLEYGADVNSRQKNDMSALDCAIENIELKIIEILISSGADVNAKDMGGHTPLHRAVDIEAEEAKYAYDCGDFNAIPTTKITSILIAAGADVNAKNNAGKTPLDWAIDAWHESAEELLRKHGARQGTAC